MFKINEETARIEVDYSRILHVDTQGRCICYIGPDYKVHYTEDPVPRTVAFLIEKGFNEYLDEQE